MNSIWRTVYVAADHAGFAHKEEVKMWLQREQFEVIDVGAFTYDSEDDFPGFMFAAAAGVEQSQGTACAIIFGGSGQGEAMAANRFPGVRATVFYGGDAEIITLSRSHNNANVLSFGARFVTVAEVQRHAWTWLHTPCNTTEKYQRRNEQLLTPPFL